MPLHVNPANTRLATDIKIYRRKLGDPEVADEIREELKKKDPAYNAPADISTGQAYRDFAAWQADPTLQVPPHRLGAGLDVDRPEYLKDSCQGANRLPLPVKNTTVHWTPPDQTEEIEVDIRDDGAIVHRICEDGEPVELEDAHAYMHGIFNRILYDTRDRLETINLRLEAYIACVSETNPARVEADAYSAAVTAFENFQASLQPGGDSPYSGAFNFVAIDPVVTNEGFIVSCRVKLNWKNPYHSSSTFKVP